jgi:two-component system, chemotaxis family, chemotaxis protein CheY
MLRIDIHRLSFLVVDANAYMRQITRTLLNGYGVRNIREAEDGGAAFGIFGSYNPDIVLTEHSLRTVDGLELTRMIRNSDGHGNAFVPVIMCTNRTDRHFVADARDAGVTEFLAKPFSAKSLYERLVYVVANPRPFIKSNAFFGPTRRRHSTVNHDGPERRQGGESKVTLVEPLLEKANILDRKF